MAQIVTITNPLTGQPAEVDQLDHTAQEIDAAIARALPGGAIDITLQNKAATDLTNVSNETMKAKIENSGFSSGSHGKESTDYPGCYYITVDGVVEWFNPPMIPSKEYRTTERWRGKPVYVMVVDFGALPNASKAEVYHRIPDINYVVSPTGTAKNPTDGWTFNFPSSPRLPYVSALMVSTQSIIASTSVDWSKYNLYVTIKYTKTTD